MKSDETQSDETVAVKICAGARDAGVALCAAPSARAAPPRPRPARAGDRRPRSKVLLRRALRAGGAVQQGPGACRQALAPGGRRNCSVNRCALFPAILAFNASFIASKSIGVMIGIATAPLALDLLTVQFTFCAVFFTASSTRARKKKVN